MSVKNISEQLFEDYLRLQGLSFEFEKPYPGKSKLVDYTVPLCGRGFLFEVKQFEQKNYPLPTSMSAFRSTPPRGCPSMDAQSLYHTIGVRAADVNVVARRDFRRQLNDRCKSAH